MAPPKKQLTAKEKEEAVAAALDRIKSGVVPESRPLINDYKSTKKREKRLKYSCPGARLCKSLTCNHIYVKPSAPDTKATKAEEDRTILVLVEKLISDGLTVSVDYAKTKFLECDSKLLDAIKAIKEDIQRREKALEDAGRFCIEQELSNALRILHHPKYLELHHGQREAKPWDCKDLILDCIEKEDAAFKEFTDKGEKSRVSMQMRGNSRLKKFHDSYKAEAEHRVNRVMVLNDLLDQVMRNEITPNQMVAVMKEYDDGLDSEELLKECVHLIAKRDSLIKGGKGCTVSKEEDNSTAPKANKGKGKTVDVSEDKEDPAKPKTVYYESVSEEESSATAALVRQYTKLEAEELTPLFTRLTEKLRAGWCWKIGPYLPVKFDLRSIADRPIQLAACLNFLKAFHWSCPRTAELYIRISGSGALAIDLYGGYIEDIRLYLLDRGLKNRVYTEELDRLATQFSLLLLEASEMAEEEIEDDA